MSAPLSFRLRLGLAVIAGLLAFELLLTPLIRWQDEMVRNTWRLREAVARKEGLLGHDEDVRIAAEEIAGRVERLSAFYPVAPDPRALQLALQQRMEALAGELGFRVQSTDWLPATTTGLIRAPVGFRLEIAPEQFLRLLYALETSEHFITIDRIQLTSRPTSEHMTAALDVSAYGRPDGDGL